MCLGCPSEVRVHNIQVKKLGCRFCCPSHSTRIVESRNVKLFENDLISGSNQFQDIGSDKTQIDV